MSPEFEWTDWKLAWDGPGPKLTIYFMIMNKFKILTSQACPYQLQVLKQKILSTVSGQKCCRRTNRWTKTESIFLRDVFAGKFMWYVVCHIGVRKIFCPPVSLVLNLAQIGMLELIIFPWRTNWKHDSDIYCRTSCTLQHTYLRICWKYLSGRDN